MVATSRFANRVGRRLLLVAVVVFAAIAGPDGVADAAAKVTFRLCPAQPIAGQSTTLVVNTWLSGENGPDRSHPADMTGYPFDVRVYRADEFPGTSAPADRGFPIELRQMETSLWHATITFPSAGSWTIAFRNWFPPLAAPPPPGSSATLDVTVLPQSDKPGNSGASCLQANDGDAIAASQDAAPFDPVSFAFAVELVAEGFERPVHVADPGDGSGRLFVVEQAGSIKIVRDGQVLDEPFLDIVDRVGCCGERGLLSIAFHPNYAENGLFFVDYTDLDGDTQIVRYHVDPANPDRADPASAETILSVDQPASNHNGGLLLFGPDGYIYVGFGDGGGGNGQNGQKLDTLLGKILRIDVDRQEGGTPYAIPPDNPFVGRQDARPEIWVYGLRNPWRFGFDRATGDLWIGDVGSAVYEEVDLVPAGSGGGLNFGWNLMEGNECRQDGDCGTFVAPVAGFDRDTGCVVTGGTVYRGSAVPALAGIYLYADYCGGDVWGLGRDAAGNWVVAGPVATGLRISSFGEDAAGEIYVVDLDGGLYRIVATA